MSANAIVKELREKSDLKKAKVLQGFFKTGKGQYGEGDIFIGVTVPESRKIAKKHCGISLEAVKKLLSSKIHEERLVSLLILVEKYEKGGERERKKIYRFYLRNLGRVNNWDLVDLSAPKIIGHHLLFRSRKPLYSLSKSPSLWKRRVSIISTLRFIREGDFSDTLKIASALLSDSHDLIHKAVGWMLREVGKRDMLSEEEFLKRHLKKVPRTALRYAIERFPWSKKALYMRR